MLHASRSRIGWLLTMKSFTVLAVMGLFFIFININCAVHSRATDDEYALRNSIQKFYKNWKRSNFEGCWELKVKEDPESKNEFIDECKKARFKIKDFEILTISKDAGKAKVKMRITIEENHKKYQDVSYDYWEFKNGSWLMADGGRKDGLDDVVKPVEFQPDKFLDSGDTSPNTQN